MRRHHTHARDSSLLRLSRANRWLLAGSLALTGLLTDVVAHAFPSKASASTGAARKGHPHTTHGSGHSSTTTTHALKPPAQAPQSSEPSEPAGEAATEPSPEATQESEPSQSSQAPTEEPAAPAPEAAPEPQPEPEVHEAEASAPVVSGGS